MTITAIGSSVLIIPIIEESYVHGYLSQQGVENKFIGNALRGLKQAATMGDGKMPMVSQSTPFLSALHYQEFSPSYFKFPPLSCLDFYAFII